MKGRYEKEYIYYITADTLPHVITMIPNGIAVTWE